MLTLAGNLKKKDPLPIFPTNKYGILSEIEINNDPSDRTANQHWLCFPVKNIKYHYTTSWDTYSKGSAYEKSWLCEWSFRVNDNNIQYHYIARATADRESCRKIFSDWKKIKKNEEYACINGEFNFLEDNKTAVWTYVKIKTKKGCLDFFEGDCDASLARKR